MTQTALVTIVGGLLTLTTNACGDDDGSTGSSTTHEHEDHGTTEHEDHGTTEHEDHGTTEHEDHGTTEHEDHGTTEHEDHGTTEHEDHGTTDVGTTGGTTGEGYMPPTAEEYCACMLDICHDLYHDTWGEDHVRSEQMCIASFDATPSAGMPAMEGDSKECRAYHCEAAAKDESLCESALGGGVCE